MKITLELLRSKGACSAGMTWVEENLPNGAEYQVFLDALAAADKPDWASWLLANFGRTTDIKTVTAVTAGTKHIFAAGRLVFECSVSVLGGIEAGGGIKAGFQITCKLDITVRLRIFAGVCDWRLPSAEETTITCRAVKSGTVAFGLVVKA